MTQDPVLKPPALDPWWLIATGLWLAPVLFLLPLGVIWIYQQQVGLIWLVFASLCALSGLGLQLWLRHRQRQMLASRLNIPDPNWAPSASAAWALVERMAVTLEPADWPLDQPERLGLLAHQVLEQVARHFHPEIETPTLELRVPDLLLILERASRDLRMHLIERVPLSHRLTLGTLVRVYRWQAFAERLFGLYRAGRLVIDPVQAVLGEFWGELRRQGLLRARDELQRWLLQEGVRLIGRYAIELYSGRLLHDDSKPIDRLTEVSRRDLDRAAESEREPLRILVLGRANSGKSSLINALFDEPRAATDLLPRTTRGFTPYRLEAEGMGSALVLDSPAIERIDPRCLESEVAVCDLILWVSAVHRPDRQSERSVLARLRAQWARQLDRHPPPLLAVATHIDQLRPAREWQPPYDLQNPGCLKARNIRDAILTLAQDLEIPVERIIPVCLAPGRVYNVADTLWKALLANLDGAQRVRLLRCHIARQREEGWRLLRRQLAAAGRYLLRWPAVLGSRSASKGP